VNEITDFLELKIMNNHFSVMLALIAKRKCVLRWVCWTAAEK
jgi:hypothetical protein